MLYYYCQTNKSKTVRILSSKAWEGFSLTLKHSLSYDRTPWKPRRNKQYLNGGYCQDITEIGFLRARKQEFMPSVSEIT